MREGQPAGGGLRRAEQGDQRIAHHLHHHDPAGQHEQRQQEQAECGAERGRNKQQTAEGHHAEANHRPAHIAHPLHQRRTRQADKGIGGKEAELHQHRLGIVQREQALQLGDDHIVQAGDAAEDEKQANHQHPQMRGPFTRAGPVTGGVVGLGADIGLVGWQRHFISFLQPAIRWTDQPANILWPTLSRYYRQHQMW